VGVLFVAAAIACVSLQLSAGSWWWARSGRARNDLARREEAGLRAAAAPRTARAGGGAAMAELPFPFAYLNRRLRLGGIAVSVQGVVLLAAVGAVACWAVAAMIVGPGWVAVAASAGGLWAPVLWIEREAGRRREAMAGEMERIASAMEGALSAGMVAYEAILEVALATGGILGPELLRVVADADRVGLSEALALLRPRLPLPEVQLFVAALRLNQGAGTGLGPALAGLHRTLRERRETGLALRAATAAGLWQANMLIAVPPLLLMFLRQVYPQFEAPLLLTSGGRFMLCAAAAWLGLGYVVVRRMCVPREMV